MEDGLEERGRQDNFTHWNTDNICDGKTWEIEKISLLAGVCRILSVLKRYYQ